MDEKSDIAKMESRMEKSKLVGVSMLLLSLLLVASVASLIYVAVANGNSDCQTTNQPEIDASATVTFKSDYKEVQERVEYSRGGHMSYLYGSDGEFDFDDFRKGIHLTRNNDDGVCYLIPFGANQTLDGLVEDFLEEWDGRVVEVKTEIFQMEIYDGKVTDVSFLPQKVQNECTNGYQWMVIISEGDSTAEDGEVSRTKRSKLRSCCRCCCHCGCRVDPS